MTNLNGYNFLDDSGNFYTDATHVTERMTMIDPNTMHFEGTIDDPKAYTKPWKIAWPMVRETDPKFEFLEEACREGERDVPRFRRAGYEVLPREQPAGFTSALTHYLKSQVSSLN